MLFKTMWYDGAKMQQKEQQQLLFKARVTQQTYTEQANNNGCYLK